MGDFGLYKCLAQNKKEKLKVQVNNKSDSSCKFTHIGLNISEVPNAKVKDSESNTKKVYKR